MVETAVEGKRKGPTQKHTGAKGLFMKEPGVGVLSGTTVTMAGKERPRPRVCFRVQRGVRRCRG